MNILLLAAAILAAVLWASQGIQGRRVSLRLETNVARADSFIRMLGLDPRRDGFTFGEEARTAKGNKRRRIWQTYGGLEVVGASAAVELTRDGHMRGTVSGNLVYDLRGAIPAPSACTRNRQQLLRKCKSVLRRQGVDINHMEVENFKMTKKVDPGRDEVTPKLVYEVEFYLWGAPNPSRPFFMLDACDRHLAVIRQFDLVQDMTSALKGGREKEQRDTHHRSRVASPRTKRKACSSRAPAFGLGGNAKIGQRTYGQRTPHCLLTEVSGSTCIMNSTYATVIDMENTEVDNGRSPVQFDCAAGYNDPVNDAYGVASDTFYHSYSMGRMYEDWYGIRALNYIPKVKIHYKRCWDNAVFNGRDLLVGDGCTLLYPLVDQNVLAHELGHAITHVNSGLYYEKQSGGINEAFSDMSGETAELFTTGTVDWEMGREIAKNGALRYFETPSQDGHSIDSANDYYDGLNVHFSSGVFNRAFFRLVTVQGVPMRQAYEIFLLANRVFWTQTTNFTEGACDAMRASYDLAIDVHQLRLAFDAVDIGVWPWQCDYQTFSQTIADGERREDVLVSSVRNPVFAMEKDAKIFSLHVDNNHGMPVTVSVTSDADGADVIVSGMAPFSSILTSEMAYYKLSASGDDDKSIAVTAQFG